MKDNLEITNQHFRKKYYRFITEECMLNTNHKLKKYLKLKIMKSNKSTTIFQYFQIQLQ